jgi:Tfp pilus assembly protein PilF
MFNLAFLYRTQEKFELAERYFKQAIEFGHVEAMNGIGLLYSVTEKYADAEKYLLQAIAAGHVGALNNLGDVYMKLNEEDKARHY